MATSTVTIVVEAQDKTGGVFDRVASSVQTLGKVALAGVGALAAGAGAAGAAIVSLAANAEPLVGLQSGFATVTERMGSSAGEMLSRLQEASAGLIDNRTLMQSFNKAAALVGDDFANTLPDAMSLVQRAATATGQDFGFLMDSLVTGVGRVSPMILDNLGIQVSLAEVTEHAAEMFGKQADELTKTEQQMALNEIVMGKLTDAYGEMEVVQQPIAQLRTMMANLRDEVGLRLLPAVMPLAEMFVSLAQQALPVLFDVLEGRVVPAIESVVEWIGRLFAVLTEGAPISEFFTVFEDGSSKFGNFIELFGVGEERAQELAATLIGLKDQVVAFLGPVVEAVAGFVSWKDVMLAIAIAIGSVVIPALLPIIGAIAAVIATAAVLSLAIAALRKAWETNFLGIRDKTRAVMTFVQNLITTVVGAIRAFWEQNGEAILANARQTWETIQAVISTVINVIKTIITAVANAIGAAWDQHGASILAAAQNFWSAIRDFIAREIANIKDIITNIANGIKAFWDRHGESIRATADRIWGLVKQIIDNSMAGIATLLNTFAALFRGDWDAFLEGIKSLWSTSWDNIKLALSAAKEALVEVLRIIIDELKGPFESAINSVKGVWETAMGRIEEVIQPVVDRINALKSAAQSFYDWIKNKVFNFNINLPELPSWALPGSPLPIHTAWKSFAQDVGRMRIQPQVDFSAVAPTLGAGPVASTVGPRTTINNNYYLNANYPYQRETSVASDLRVISMLRG